MKKRKVLTTMDSGSREYVSLCFSPDGKLIAAQGGAPEWNLVLWIWEKSKVACTVKTTNQMSSDVYQCAFNLQDPTVFSVVGYGIFKSFRSTAEGGVRLLPSALGKREQNYTCHAWLPDSERCVVATDSGDLLLVEAGEVKTSLAPFPEGNSIEVITAYSKGFVCAGSGGIVAIYERTEEKDFFKKAKTFTIDGHAVKVKSLAVSLNEESVICALEDNQMVRGDPLLTLAPSPPHPALLFLPPFLWGALAMRARCFREPAW